MKCAILTITDGTNYGNRLQNYAMQEILQLLGFETETIKRKTSRDLAVFRYTIYKTKCIIKRIIGRSNSNRGNGKRTERFAEFNKKYIIFSKYCLQNNKAPTKINNKYDYFVCGSDQIWNTKYAFVRDDIKNHLAFFASPQKKIAYAASFGTDQVDEACRNVFAELLPSFKAIGVRECAGVAIVKDICGRDDAQSVLDPTLLLPKEKWEQIARKPKYIGDKKYVLTYFLGGRSLEISNRINEICELLHCTAINLEKENKADKAIEDIDIFSTAPDEFVWLIQNAECILTDSFHACVFSIIFGKTFVAY